jgi:sugar/nucleoside kinase (ribokinase family)
MTGRERPEEILGELTSAGIHGAVLKLGRNGAAALVNGQMIRVQPPAVEAIDTTGAGDAFDAGLIDAILDSQSVSAAIARGCLCGSLSTRRAGAISALPGREELDLYYEQIRQS